MSARIGDGYAGYADKRGVGMTILMIGRYNGMTYACPLLEPIGFSGKVGFYAATFGSVIHREIDKMHVFAGLPLLVLKSS